MQVEGETTDQGAAVGLGAGLQALCLERGEDEGIDRRAGPASVADGGDRRPFQRLGTPTTPAPSNRRSFSARPSGQWRPARPSAQRPSTCSFDSGLSFCGMSGCVARGPSRAAGSRRASPAPRRTVLAAAQHGLPRRQRQPAFLCLRPVAVQAAFLQHGRRVRGTRRSGLSAPTPDGTMIAISRPISMRANRVIEDCSGRQRVRPFFVDDKGGSMALPRDPPSLRDTVSRCRSRDSGGIGLLPICLELTFRRCPSGRIVGDVFERVHHLRREIQGGPRPG